MSDRPGLKQINLRISDKLIKRVDKEAKKEKRTRTNMIEILLEESIDERTRKNNSKK